MSVNTFEHNQRQCQLTEGEEVWLFGYGSLIYLVDFPYIESKTASIRGWSRRFWQGSHDHRGTESSPGRVVTLIEEAGAICHGVAYKVEASVFEWLDVREKNGYLRLSITMAFEDETSETGLVYIATSDNDAYLGEASEYDIAYQIATAKGPSGTNSDYLLELADSLRNMGVEDEHIFTIEKYLHTIDTN
ncbi:MAG: gamma-glutamylcyclotransferase [Gammaproteobacteria bacterium]|nr:gamma-glutamylcyclotransferase [Gammaproteobacteria bacterium]